MVSRKQIFCIGTVVLIIAVVLVILLTGKANPYNTIFRNAEQRIDSISLKRGVREFELTDDEILQITALLKDIRLPDEDDPAYYTMTGPHYYDLQIRLKNGREFVLSVCDDYYLVQSDPESAPKGYPVSQYHDRKYSELVRLAAALYEEFFPKN